MVHGSLTNFAFVPAIAANCDGTFEHNHRQKRKHSLSIEQTVKHNKRTCFEREPFHTTNNTAGNMPSNTSNVNQIITPYEKQNANKKKRVTFQDGARDSNRAWVPTKDHDGLRRTSRYFQQIILNYWNKHRDLTIVSPLVHRGSLEAIESICNQVEALIHCIEHHGSRPILPKGGGKGFNFSRLHLGTLEELLDDLEEYHQKCIGRRRTTTSHEKCVRV